MVGDAVARREGAIDWLEDFEGRLETTDVLLGNLPGIFAGFKQECWLFECWPSALYLPFKIHGKHPVNTLSALSVFLCNALNFALEPPKVLKITIIILAFNTITMPSCLENVCAEYSSIRHHNTSCSGFCLESRVKESVWDTIGKSPTPCQWLGWRFSS